MHTLLSKTFRILNNLIQPYYCSFCFKVINYNSNFSICEDCIKKIEINPPPFCRNCGKSISNYPAIKNICKDCLWGRTSDFKIYYPLKYRGIVRKGLHKVKYEKKLDLIKFFIPYMLSLLKEYVLPFEKIDYIIYVPLHPKKLKEREFNQSYILAREIASKVEIPLIKDSLIRTRYTKPQSQLSEKERSKNVNSAFKINTKSLKFIRGSKLLLIDDIITTGSTVRECIKEIKKYDARVLVLTVAGG